jgi:hypothetical protein
MPTAADLLLAAIPVEELADRTAQPVTQALMIALPEAVRRARLGAYLNEEQAQEETGLTKRQLRYLRNQRRIPYRKIGARTILYNTHELFEAIDAGVVPARDPIAR